MSVYAYTRVSTQEQSRHGVSLAAQEERIRQFCAFQGFILDEVISDPGISAGKKLHKRKGGKLLLEKLQWGDHVVATKLDRMFRDVRNALEVIDEWGKKGITVHFIDFGGNAIDSKGAAGRFILTILAAVAEMERTLVSERTAATTAYCKTHLRKYGNTPYGFKKENKQLVPYPKELEVLSRIRDMKDGGMSLQGIADRLNWEKVPTKTNKTWHHNTVSVILKNWKSLYAEVIDR